MEFGASLRLIRAPPAPAARPPRFCRRVLVVPGRLGRAFGGGGKVRIGAGLTRASRTFC